MRPERGNVFALATFAGTAALILLLADPLAKAQPAAIPGTAAQNVLQQVALGKARTELLARVRALPLTPELTIGGWLSADADLDRAARLWIRTQPRQGNARLYSDGVCEVDVCIRAEELGSRLVQLSEDYPSTAAARGVDADGVKSAARRWPTVWVTGRATLSRQVQPGQLPGWEDVTSEGIQLARRAAEDDACRALVEEAGRLKISQTRRLREFLDAGEAVRNAVYEALRREAAVKVEFETDQVATARVRIGIRELLRILTRVHEEHYKGDQFEAADFREMALLAGRDDLTASGLATPPERTIMRDRYATIELNAPAWAGQTRSAVGRYELPDNEPDKTAQERAARLDGIDKLRRDIEKLVIQKGVTVSAFLGYHQDLKEDVVLFLSGARPKGQPRTLPGDAVEVEVEVPLRRLWEIVRRDMKLEEVEPPESGDELGIKN